MRLRGGARWACVGLVCAIACGGAAGNDSARGAGETTVAADGPDADPAAHGEAGDGQAGDGQAGDERADDGEPGAAAEAGSGEVAGAPPTSGAGAGGAVAEAGDQPGSEPDRAGSAPAEGGAREVDAAPIPEPQLDEEIAPALRARLDRARARLASPPADASAACAYGALLTRAGDPFTASELLTDTLQRVEEGRARPAPDAATVAACHFNLGRAEAAAMEEPGAALPHFVRARRTPNARRRRVVTAALLDAAVATITAEGCDAFSVPALRMLLTLGDRAPLRRCVRELEAGAPLCEAVDPDSPDHPGEGPERELFDQVRRASPDLAFALVGGALHLLRGRDTHLCNLGYPPDARLVGARRLELAGQPLFLLHTTEVISYACECEEELDPEEGALDEDAFPTDCRCEEAFDTDLIVDAGGTLLLARIADYSEVDGMVGVSWDEPLLRLLGDGVPRVEGGRLRLGGQALRLVDGMLVP